MRELKFRAYDSATGKVSEPFDIKESWGDYLIDFEDYSTDGALDSIIWEQYTGLKDKNGKEIYEGDIVGEEFAYGGEETKTIWQVRWCDDECAFELHYVSGFEVDDCSLVADDEENYEIIGNIHENAELLEEK